MSELHGDPGALPDEEGEYLELIHTAYVSVFSDTLRVAVDSSDTLTIPPQNWEPLEVYLICRDSLAMQGVAIACQREWNNLSLSNSSGHTIEILGANTAIFHTPPPASGSSWENTLEETTGWSMFESAQTLLTNGDRGSPGAMYPRSKYKYQSDASIESVALDTSTGVNFRLVLQQKGAENISNVLLKVTLDRDWDGAPELTLDEKNLILDEGVASSYSWTADEAFQGVYRFELTGDDNPYNNFASHLLSRPPAFQITEVCPDPPEGESEWIEIRNVDNFRKALNPLQYNGSPLLPGAAGSLVVGPGAFVILTQDSARFAARYGPVDPPVLEISPWDILKNTGDTVRVSLGDTVILDEMIYTSSEKDHCLNQVINKGSWVQNEEPTPGSLPDQSRVFSWNLSGKLFDKSKPDTPISIEVKAPLDFEYTVDVFSLSGQPLGALCSACSGTDQFDWYGADGNGRLLPIGPYIIRVKPSGKAPEKKTVVIARQL